MAALAVDLGAAVLVDGVVAGQEDGPVGDAMVEDELGQEPCQPERGPAAPGEDAVIAGGMAGGQSPAVRRRLETVRRPVVRMAATSRTRKR